MKRWLWTVVLLTAWGCGGDAPAADDSAVSGEAAAAAPGVEIEYIAHASFILRADDGTELLIDPFASRVWLGYDWPEGIEPDAILITHPHYDHDAGRFREMPFPWSEDVPVVDAPGRYSFGAFEVTGVEGKHADPYGKEFGQLNTIMVIEVAGLRIAHLGDNGPLTPGMAAAVGDVDVLMMPGDAAYHILSEEATREVMAELSPEIVIPMHYRLGDLEADADAPSGLGDLDPWLEGRSNVVRVGGNTTTLRAAELPTEREILVFDHAPYLARPDGGS
jgi:L-ascorbate metabolism protein UlaG (beta-lactamase superfamily)